jgi:hypothetical protein
VLQDTPRRVDALNSELNRWEQIKKFVIAERELTVEAGDLTPSVKCVARWSSRGLPIAFRVFTNEVGVLRRRSEWRRPVDASVG